MKGSQREKVLGELGVMWVTYGLTCSGWDVFRKINERGFDVLAERNGKKQWIEIKTRDVLLTRGKNSKYVTVGQSPRQRETSDYLAVYLHGAYTCLLIPTTLPQIASSQSRNSIKVGEWDREKQVFMPKSDLKRYLDNYEIK